MDKNILILFGRFPREVALHRQVIDNSKQLKKYINNVNGIDNCYVSVYAANFLIEKIFFDFDFGDHVLSDAKNVYSWCRKEVYQVIPIASGNGTRIHLYMRTKPKIYGPTAKIALTKATYSILKSVFGSFKQETLFIAGKQSRVLRTKDRIIAPDPAVIGDVRRLARIPQTLRPPENLNYCTFLPPDEFLDMTEEDIINHIKKPHTYEYEWTNNAPLLTDFEYDFDESVKFNDFKKIIPDEEIVTSNPSLFLQGLLRPCLYNSISTIHPSHDARCAATIDLIKHGYSPDQITSIYSTLGWEDFEYTYCLSQVKSCTRYKPYSCKKIRSLGMVKIGCCIG